MEFCPKCGSLIMVNNGKAKCAGCGHTPKKVASIKSSEKIEKTKTIAVISEKEETYPEVEMDCAKCENKKAYFWTMQTRSSDEPETRFYKCTKCNHTWRVYR
jgi:DNA-directed RNA polymerase subunit M